MAKTVYLGMIGDIMHPGLINIINEGAKYGDVMIGLFTDKAIATHKRLPYLNYEQRKNVIENIRGVSKIVPQDEWSYVENLKRYKPDYIIHGDDWLYGPDKYIRDEVFKVLQLSVIGRMHERRKPRMSRGSWNTAARFGRGYAAKCLLTDAEPDGREAVMQGSAELINVDV